MPAVAAFCRTVLWFITPPVTQSAQHLAIRCQIHCATANLILTFYSEVMALKIKNDPPHCINELPFKKVRTDPEKLIPWNCLKTPEWYRLSALTVFRYSAGNLSLK